jgi:hypothetical protein
VSSTPTVRALFDDLRDVDQALQALLALGLTEKEISVISHDVVGDYSASLPGPGHGALLAVAGGLTGFVVGLGALAMPDLALVLQAGPVAATLSPVLGAGAGALTGSLASTLPPFKVPETEIGIYAEGVRRGGFLMLVQPAGHDAETIRQILAQTFAVDIHERAAAWRRGGWAGYDPQAPPFSLDEVKAERRRYALPGAFARYEPSFREHCQQTKPVGDDHYVRLRPAYVYGWRLKRDPRYRHWKWAALERAARKGWERRYANTPWVDVQEAVRFAWQATRLRARADEDPPLRPR